MLLPNGVTGFTFHKPKINLNDVKRDCYAVVYLVSGQIIKIIDKQYPRNFYEVVFKIRDQFFHVLFNDQYPIIAVATHVDYFCIKFTNDRQLNHHFKNLGYQVLCTDQLNTPLSMIKLKKKIAIANVNELNKTELEQIQYWKPKTVGEVIFNFWD